MSGDSNYTYEYLKGFFDKKVETDVSLDSLGINPDEFRSEARDIILQRVHDFAADRYDENS